MSLAYCYHCLERADQCDCDDGPEGIIYGEHRVMYLHGYRDALAGKPEAL